MAFFIIVRRLLISNGFGNSSGEVGDFLLQENGDFLLLEDGFKIEL